MGLCAFMARNFSAKTSRFFINVNSWSCRVKKPNSRHVSVDTSKLKPKRFGRACFEHHLSKYLDLSFSSWVTNTKVSAPTNIINNNKASPVQERD
jgi:hypothetical protein